FDESWKADRLRLHAIGRAALRDVRARSARGQVRSCRHFIGESTSPSETVVLSCTLCQVPCVIPSTCFDAIHKQRHVATSSWLTLQSLSCRAGAAWTMRCSLVALPTYRTDYASRPRKPHEQNWSSERLCNFDGSVPGFLDARFDRIRPDPWTRSLDGTGVQSKVRPQRQDRGWTA